MSLFIGSGRGKSEEVCRRIRSRNAALSLTVLDTTLPTLKPLQHSAKLCWVMVKPRLGFKPNRPQHDEGILIEPPPSVACAAGTIPAATAAAAPPDDPPVE